MQPTLCRDAITKVDSVPGECSVADIVTPHDGFMMVTSPPTLPKFHEGTSMRNSSPTNAEIREGNQTVFFQIANGNSRQACSVKTKFSTQQQASRYLRQNWNKIEQIARDSLARGLVEEGCINLVMI